MPAEVTSMNKGKLAEEAFEKVKEIRNAKPKSSQNDEAQSQIYNSAQYRPLSYISRTKNHGFYGTCKKTSSFSIFCYRIVYFLS